MSPEPPTFFFLLAACYKSIRNRASYFQCVTLKAASEETLSPRDRSDRNACALLVRPRWLEGHSPTLWMGAKLVFRASFVYQWRPGGKTLDGERIETQRLCDESGAQKKPNACRASEKIQHQYRQHLSEMMTMWRGRFSALFTRWASEHNSWQFTPSNTPLISFGPTPTSSSSSPAFMLDLQQLLSSGRRAHQWVGSGGDGGWGGGLGPPRAHMCSQHLRNALFSSPSVVTSVNKTARCFPLPLCS